MIVDEFGKSHAPGTLGETMRCLEYAGLITVVTGERANPFGIFHSNRESSERSLSHFRYGTGKPVARCQNRSTSSRDPGVVQNSHSQIEKVLSEHRDFTQYL